MHLRPQGGCIINGKGFPTSNTMYWHFFLEMDVWPIFCINFFHCVHMKAEIPILANKNLKNRHFNLVTFGTGTYIAQWTASYRHSSRMHHAIIFITIGALIVNALKGIVTNMSKCNINTGVARTLSKCNKGLHVDILMWVNCKVGPILMSDIISDMTYQIPSNQTTSQSHKQTDRSNDYFCN